MNSTNKTHPETGLEIAVIGMAGRFPGAPNIDRFWENLKNGIESISFFSDEELLEAGIDPGMLENSDYIKAAGGILEDKEYFDAAFFGYSAVEAELMDPQIRIFHECAWHALEDAGYDPFSFDGLIGLYAGASFNLNWEALSWFSARRDIMGDFVTWLLIDRDNLCTRVSYIFNLKGPSMVVKTACSTSLVAVHTACQSIINGECDIALAGGITITKLNKAGYLYHENMIFSRDGHCRSFDARARGTIGGDGVGIVVLKRFKDAAAEGDHIYALIKGTAVNNDGIRKAGYTAPSMLGQSEVIEDAFRVAEIEPQSITYVETHGTGTVVGDPIEIEGLKYAFNTEKKHFCRVGSVKTNIGHLDSAAGIAGFIKTVLALKHRLIPPSLHYETPNPGIDFDSSPFYVNTRLSAWKCGGHPLRAGVSSFGIGGTNAHLVLEEALKMEESSSDRTWKLLLLSAKTRSALERCSIDLLEFLKKNPEINLADAAYTLQLGRRSFCYRRMLICKDTNEAAAALMDSSARKVQTYYAKEEKKSVIFIFPGLGAQYVNMGVELYRSLPLFREEIDRCFEILAPLLNYDIREILYPSQNIAENTMETQKEGERSFHDTHRPPQDINHIQSAQLAVFIVEYALARSLMKWGIKPHAMIGYSFGEYTAACLAGVFSLEEALKLVVIRGELISRLKGGSMLSVPLTADRLKPLLPPGLSLAIDNGPSCIAAGLSDDIDIFEKQLKEKRYICMKVPNSHALHSPLMEPILDEFTGHLSRVKLNRPQIPYVSNVTGTWITNMEATSPKYWANHLQETVQFAAGIDLLKKEPEPIFVEIGPGRDLCVLLARHNQQDSAMKAINFIPPSQQDEIADRYLLKKLGQLWLYGITVDWRKFYEREKRRRISLPLYSFDRMRFWFEGNPLQDLNAELIYRSLARMGKPAPPDTAESHEYIDNFPQRVGLDTVYVSPSNKSEENLALIWQEFFGIGSIGVNDDFFDMGGDSLKASLLISRILKKMNVLIPLVEFFKRPTIKALALYITNNNGKNIYFSIEPAEKRNYYPLSQAQKGLYVLWQLDNRETAYNIPSVSLLEGKFDKDRFENAFKYLLKKHESLRTSLEMIAEEPAQRIWDDVEFMLEYRESKNEQEINGDSLSMIESVLTGFIQPFDLSKAPLLRVCVVPASENRRFLLIDMHHIISDGYSNNLLLSEFAAVYNDDRPLLLRLQYKDFSQWQDKWAGDKEIKSQEEYWLKQFAENIPTLDIQTDYPRPERMNFNGDYIYFTIDKELENRLRFLMKDTGVTMYMVLLAAFNVLLAKYTGREDIMVGTPITGRSHPDLEKIIGMFVNMLVMRNFPQHDKTFKNFLGEVKENALKAYENQDYQFEELVRKLNLQGNFARNSLFDVVFQLNNLGTGKLEIGDLKILPIEAKIYKTQFDLILNADETPAGIRMHLAFNSTLFKRETAEKLTVRYREILEQVTNNSELKFRDIKISHERMAIKVDKFISDANDFGF